MYFKGKFRSLNIVTQFDFDFFVFNRFGFKKLIARFCFCGTNLRNFYGTLTYVCYIREDTTIFMKKKPNSFNLTVYGLKHL